MRTLNLDQDWWFRRDGEPGSQARITLPHGAFLSTPDGGHHWLGECSYQRRLTWPDPCAGERCALFVAAAMHTARVRIDGAEVASHAGGYLPFEVDLTEWLRDGRPHQLEIRVDNRPTPHVPPGKPFEELDFCWYGGLYRGVELRIYPPVCITDPIAAGEVAGGGVFVRTRSADAAAAEVEVRVHVRNQQSVPGKFQVEAILHHAGRLVASGQQPLQLRAGESGQVEIRLHVTAPALWSPDHPALHDLQVRLLDAAGRTLDERRLRCGVRRIHFSRSKGFVINGRRHRLRGTNRHQEHPWVGYAVPPAAEWRDARRIKSAGFDYVRLSHYPQAPAFLDACDELGLVVMNAIPGWQFIGGETFRRECRQAARDLIRRDRNHPSVVLWELSLNETAMDPEFMRQMQALGHEEYPGDQMFTCGWLDHFDVYIHSRQHGDLHHWRNGDKALVVAEYGDWEFYARNAGFDQPGGNGVLAAWANSRQFRRGGERALLQQAWNHALAASDCLASSAVLDGQWAMFDYARGYAPIRAAVGLMDSFRLPKFSYHFYRSQREPHAASPTIDGGPMVFIASHWTAASALRVTVFSNCESVELQLNGRVIGQQPAESGWATQHLPHPPFVFDLPRFEPGELAATGYLAGAPVAAHQVRTPTAPAALSVWADWAGRVSAINEPDLVFVHAALRDAADILCVETDFTVVFATVGADLVSPAQVDAEAGVASALVRVAAGATGWAVQARELERGWAHGVELVRAASQSGAPAVSLLT